MSTNKLPDAPHRDAFFANSKEVLRLLEIHKEISGDGPGYKHNVEVLNKSAIVLLVATWESYIEDLAKNSFEFLLKNSKSHEAIPKKILASSVKDLKGSQNELDVWQLAGNGWQDILQRHHASVLKKYVKSLNTPRTDNIDELFESLLGIKNISSNWHWKRMSASSAKEKLEVLIRIRGEIAHTVYASKSINKGDVKNYDSFLNNLAMITHNTCTRHLESVCGTKPWTTYKSGG
jgi:hypothetical protein